KTVTDAFHKAGGLFVLQLGHVGLVSHSMYLEGAQPVAPIAIAPDGHVSLVRAITAYETPRALETDEKPANIEAYGKGA
nr:alkene reductase [Neptunomonas phycophila]